MTGKHTYRRYLRLASALLLAGILFLTACDDNTDTPQPEPRNLISGVADGIVFRSTDVASVKDSSDIFLMAGSMGFAGTFLAAFNGREEMEYPIAEEGALVDLTNYLNELIAADSFFIDTSALEAIFSDSAQLLPRGTSFIYYIPQQTPFFSRRGNITLSTFDGAINRIFGTMEGEFINAADGPKYINAAFKDVFYLDCPALDNCNF
jgi:hypothetical protein